MKTNGIDGLIKTQGIGTIILELEENMGKSTISTSKMPNTSLGRLSSSEVLINRPETEGCKR